MKARVIRGVLIAGKPHAEGAIGSVREDRVPQAGDAFAITHQEFHEMRAANYVVLHVVPDPAPATTPPTVEPAVETKKPVK